MTTVSKKRSIRAIAAILSLLFAVLIVPVLFACGSKQEEETPPAAQKYTITVASCVGGSVSASAQSAEADAVITVAATPDTGYKLSTLKYNDTDITLEKSFTMPAENVTITAEFTKLSYGITLGEVQNGTASVDKTEAHYGDIITVTAAPAAGYELDKIQVNGADITGNTFTMPAQNTTVNVSFKARQYNITCAAVQNGILGASTSKAVAGATVTVAATPASGYKLKSIKYNGTDITETKSFKMPAENVTITAEFEALSYTVSINTPENGTASVDKTKAIVGETITVTATPSAGYELDFIKVDGEPISGNTFAMPAGNATVAVGFKLKEYTVTVTDAQNGTVSASAPKATAGTAITITATPSAGYELKSIVYNDGADHDITSAKTFDMPAANVTVTTVFEAIEYNVSINTPDHGTASVSKTKATVGETITVTATPSAGYELDFIKVDGEPISGNAFAMPADNVDVTVGFKLTEYTITVNNAQNGTVVADATKATMGTTVTITTTPNAGYRLNSLKYNDGEDHDISATKTFDMPAANVTVTAVFEQIPYDVAAAPATNGNVSLSVTSAVPGTAITVTATPDTGYALKSLKYNDGEDHDITATCTFDMPAGNVTVTAVFEKTYAVSIGTITGGTVSADKSVAFAGDTISITVEAEDGYAIAELKYNTTQIDISGTTYTFAMPAENVTITARFHTAHNITVNSDGNGTLNVASKAVEGVTITVTPQPNAGYELDTLKYNDGADHPIDTSSAPYTFTMPDSAVTVTVTFKKLNLTVTAASCANGNISVDKTTAQVGDEVTVTVTPATGYELDTLSYTPMGGGTEQAISSTTLKFTMPGANVTVNATFKKATYTVTAASCTNGNISVAPTSAQIGDEITVTVTPATGYELDTLTYTPAGGSAQDISKTTLKFDMQGANVTVNATFKKSDLTVSTASCTGGSVAVDKSTAQIGDTVTVTVTPDAGYELDGIKYNDGEDHAVSTATTPYTFIMPGVNVTVSATFKKINYAVTAGSCTNGSVAVDKTTAQIGDTITVTATPDEGYELDKVQVNGSDVTGTTFTMPAAAVTVTATFKLKYYTIVKTVKPHGNYTLSGDPALGSTVESGETRSTATMGTKVTVTVTPDAGYTIQELFYVIGGTITATYMTKESNNVYYFTMPAKWVRVEVRVEAIRYDVSAGACTNGSVTLSADVATVEDTITVTATPAAGYELDKVYVNGDEISGTSFDMPAENVTVTATFKKATYTVTVADGITGGTLTVSSATAQMGDTITVTATPTAGYGITQLKYTYTSGEDTISGYLYDGNSFEMPGANVTVSCVFKQITYIDTADQLLAIADTDMDGYYKLTNNLTFSGWQTATFGIAPLSPASGYNDGRGYTYNESGTTRAKKAFTGVFDGNGYTINGYQLAGYDNHDTDQQYWYHGLFGYVAPGAIVGKFTLNNCNVQGYKMTGIISGVNLGYIHDIVINSNCTTYVSYQGMGIYAAGYNAGIIKNIVCYLDKESTAWGARDMDRAVYESATGSVEINCHLLPTSDISAQLGAGWAYHEKVGNIYGQYLILPDVIYIGEFNYLFYNRVDDRTNITYIHVWYSTAFGLEGISTNEATHTVRINMPYKEGFVDGNYTMGFRRENKDGTNKRYDFSISARIEQRIVINDFGTVSKIAGTTSDELNNLMDGNTDTFVSFNKSTLPSDLSKSYIQVDLKENTLITALRFYYGRPNDSGGYMDKFTGHIGYSLDGETYLSMGQFTASQDDVKFAFSPEDGVLARYIRIYIDAQPAGWTAVRALFINSWYDETPFVLVNNNFGAVSQAGDPYPGTRTDSIYNLFDGDPNTAVAFGSTPRDPNGDFRIDMLEDKSFKYLRIGLGRKADTGSIVNTFNGSVSVQAADGTVTALGSFASSDRDFIYCGDLTARFIIVTLNNHSGGWTAVNEIYIDSLGDIIGVVDLSGMRNVEGDKVGDAIIYQGSKMYALDNDPTTILYTYKPADGAYFDITFLYNTDLSKLRMLTDSGDKFTGDILYSTDGVNFVDTPICTVDTSDFLYSWSTPIANVKTLRFRAVNWDRTNWLQIKEIYINSFGGANYCVSNGFGSIDSGNAYSNMFDGDLSTYSLSTNPTLNGTLEIELSESVDLNSICVLNGMPDGSNKLTGVLEYSTDGTTWVQIMTISGAYNYHSMAQPVNVRFLRLKNTNGSSPSVAIREIIINPLTEYIYYIDIGNYAQVYEGTVNNLVDGDVTTHLWFNSTSVGEYIDIYLNGELTVSEFSMVNGKSNGGDLLTGKVEYYDSATGTWVAFGASNVSARNETLTLGTPVTTSRIRITATAAGWTAFCEFMLTITNA